MVRDSKGAKKSYIAPSLVLLDASAAKAKLLANGEPKDPVIQKMLAFLDEQLKKGKARSHAQK